jgi:hypothetical protein
LDRGADGDVLNGTLVQVAATEARIKSAAVVFAASYVASKMLLAHDVDAAVRYVKTKLDVNEDQLPSSLRLRFRGQAAANQKKRKEPAADTPSPLEKQPAEDGNDTPAKEAIVSKAKPIIGKKLQKV